MPVYLDYCASTPIDERVLQVMIDTYRNVPGNADSRTHLFGTKAKEVVANSRRTIAKTLDVDPTEVIFTSGATESDNLAILGLANHGMCTNRRHIVSTAFEHKAVMEPLRAMEARGFEVDYIHPDSDGIVSSDAVLSKVRSDTLLVSVMHVNNELGTIQPIAKIGAELSRRDILFHIDAAQSYGKLNQELRTTPYDLLSISAHKIHGPQGIGALVMRRKRYKRPPIEAILTGGQQEYGYRPGTTPVALVAGFAKAAELAEQEYNEHKHAFLQTKQQLLQALQPHGVMVNGSIENSLPNILNISIPGIDAEALFAALKDEYAISNGSACTSGSYAPSYVLKACGYSDERIAEALRISWWLEPFSILPLLTYVNELQ